MTYTETLNYIHSLGKFKYPASLDRIKAVCECLNNPQNSFKSIHIAGTNGKGSAAVYCSEILKKSGYKTGLYTSPFIVDFRERIQINGEYISENDLVRLAGTVINTAVGLNEFEFITAVCFLYFREQKVDVAVVEVGLGGRLDATNVLGDVCVSVIAKIGLDHTAILGDTIEEITAEKCGIIRKNVPVVTLYNQDTAALSEIEKHTDNLFVPATPKIQKSDISGNRFVYDGEIYETSLIGAHQISNAVTAIEAVALSGFDCPLNAVKSAFESAKIAGRLEIVKENPTVILDGAHNPDGARALRDFLKQYNGDFTVIVAMMRDKNVEEVLKTTLGYAKKVFVTEIDNPRCEKSEVMLKTALKYNENSEIAVNSNDALKKAMAENLPIFVFGSLYLVSEARKLFKK